MRNLGSTPSTSTSAYRLKTKSIKEIIGWQKPKVNAVQAQGLRIVELAFTKKLNAVNL